ncbi:ROK family transcriptional regulator [Catenulispora sp. NF23]|uniref:ROK family transcriptional regulator n=1 Tax=Catenulispora pinistramenti TaxID=2705254 RepID=UPI001BA56C70|nr:ROK family transcriptional regulator [Catenulispora pinistramenti]MBS2533093.1 ROK family transcriptional regulator [Catenulispora pinistramenti]
MKTATPATARAINDRLALDLLIERGPLTAPQLRELTGLSRPTVADLVERLGTAGLVESVGEAEETRRGPNARLYRLIAERAHVVGVDLRRTGFTATVADLTGATVGTATRRFDATDTADAADASAIAPPANGPRRAPDLIASLAEAITQAANGRQPHIVVIGAPGMVHPHSGQSTAAPDMPGWRPDLPDELERVLGVRVLLENEVNLAAVAEHRLGAAAGHADFVLLWLDEGVGGAVVLDGRLRRGASGGAGELGWLEVDGAEFCDTIAPEVRAAITPEELAERIAKGAFAAISVLDPGLVVLGGSAGRAAGEPLAALVAARLATKSPIETEVRASTVEGDAVLHGAVLTGLDLAREEVFGG